MTDYLQSVKKLVERLDLQSSNEIRSSHVSRKKAKVKEKSCVRVSDNVFSEKEVQVRYRHRKKIIGKDFSDSTRKNKIDNLDSPSRRRSVSLYQLIKINKEKLSAKNNGECDLNLSTATSPISPVDNKQRTVFEYSVYSASDVDSEEHSLNSAVFQSHSYRPSKDTSSSLLGPITPLHLSTQKMTNSERNNSESDDKFEFRDSGLKSPLCSDPVFFDFENTESRRTSKGTCRPRLSASKSMPLSPPAGNAERVAKQCSDFQLKLDTLRAELLAMRKGDQELARKLLNLYSDIQVLKVKNSCISYSELLDEAMYEAEMADELPDMCDAPQKFTNQLLASHGVTSFNIHSRRFSCS